VTQQPAVSVASVHASNTTHGDDGTNVPRPKPRRGMDEGHSSHGAKHNGPRPTPRSPEASNSRGRAEVVPFRQSAPAAQSERTHGPRMKSASAGEVRQLRPQAKERLAERYGNSLSLIWLAYFLKLQRLRAGVLFSTRSRSLFRFITEGLGSIVQRAFNFQPGERKRTPPPGPAFGAAQKGPPRASTMGRLNRSPIAMPCGLVE
jgi:hypothetical protein